MYLVLLVLLGVAVPVARGQGLPQGARLKLQTDPRNKVSGFPPVVAALAWSPDARTIYSAGFDRHIRVWDVVGGKQVQAWQGHSSWITELVLSPDGRTLISGGTDNTSPIWDAATGRRITQLAHAGHRTFAFTPNSKEVLAGFDQVFAWSVATGKQARGLEARHGALIQQIRISCDGAILAVAGGNGKITLLDHVSGKLLHRLAQPGADTVVLTQDGRLLAAGGRDTPIRLWDVEAGQELRLITPPKAITGLAFSPRGAWLAASCFDRTVRIWDVNTGQELARLSGHGQRVQSVAFAPDGRTLASGDWSGVIFLWDLRAILAGRSEPAPVLGDRDLQLLWDRLTDRDAGMAFRALWTLAAAGAPAARLARRHLQPVAGADPARVARWLRELDAPKFAIREHASRQLAKLGDLVEGVLRNAQQNSSSAEVRRRAELLLQRLDASANPARVLGQRAIQMLEHNDAPEAKALLEHLATGSPDARLTREARAALERRRA
jgi:hypothetical protein